MDNYFTHSLPLADWKNLPIAITVYCVYAEDGTPLYVGSSHVIRRRFPGHIKSNKFPESAIIRWNEYDEANAHRLNEDERKAIADLCPAMNTGLACGRTKRAIHNPNWYGRNARERSEFHQAVYSMIWDRIDSSLSKTYVVEKLAEETALGASWLYKFVNDNDHSPSVDRLELLFKALGGTMPKFKGE